MTCPDCEQTRAHNVALGAANTHLVGKVGRLTDRVNQLEGIGKCSLQGSFFCRWVRRLLRRR